MWADEALPGKNLRRKKVYQGRRLWKLAYLVFQDVNHQLFSESVKEEVTLGLPLSEEKRRTCRAGTAADGAV